MTESHIGPGPWIDHVVVATPDAGAEAARWRESFGLGSAPGLVFPDGVESIVIPVGGQQYVELLSVIEPASLEAEELQAAGRDGPRVGLWAVATSDIGAVASRLGRALVPGLIEGDDGAPRWMLVENIDPALPFFIEYREGGRAAVWAERFAEAGHARQPDGLAWVGTPAEPAALRAWLGSAALSVRRTEALQFAVRFTDRDDLVFGGSPVSPAQ